VFGLHLRRVFWQLVCREARFSGTSCTLSRGNKTNWTLCLADTCIAGYFFVVAHCQYRLPLLGCPLLWKVSRR
jgi:hypothetical protein